jgi:predicted RNase H-like nuclease (RuvC/YqgF family)
MTRAERIERELKEMQEQNKLLKREYQQNNKITFLHKIKEFFSPADSIKYRNYPNYTSEKEARKTLEQMRLQRKIEKGKQKIQALQNERVISQNIEQGSTSFKGPYHVFVTNNQLTSYQLAFLKSQHGNQGDRHEVIVDASSARNVDVKPALATVIGHLTRMKSEYSISYKLEKIRYNSFDNPYTGDKGWHFTIYLL